MCFSASASFVAGAVLTVIGVATIKKTHHRSQLFFATIPLIFGVQQLAEGVLWVTLPYPEYYALQRVATFTFLFFAQIVWPAWVPISILLLEKRESRNKLQLVFAACGIILSLGLAYCLLSFHVDATIVEHHIVYFQDYPASLKIYGVILYILATIAPSFFSHTKRMWVPAVLILISYIVTAIFYENYALSVWCFFSSVISISIYMIMRTISNAERDKFVL